MATEPKPVTEVAKMDLFEDDDEFEEFDMNEGMQLHFNTCLNRCSSLSSAISLLGFQFDYFVWKLLILIVMHALVNWNLVYE